MTAPKLIRPLLFCLVLVFSLQFLTLIEPVSAYNFNDQTQVGSLSPLPDAPFNPTVTNLPTGPLTQKFGIATHPWWLDMFADKFIAYFKDLKITTVRLPFEWKVIEPAAGVYDWSQTDRLMNRLQQEGFDVVAEFITLPVWASSNRLACAKNDLDCKLDPAYASALSRVAELSVRRYPFIRHWEFWNEPDLWPNMGQKDISDYAPWLKLFYDAVKRVDPSIMVAATSLSGYDYTAWLYDYSEALWGMHPWDAVGYHPYTPEKCAIDSTVKKRVSINQEGVDKLRQLMVTRGDANKPIWLTEIGFLGTPEDQTWCLYDAFNFIATRPYITLAHLHMLHDWESEQYGLLKVKEAVFWRRPLQPSDEFIPKQPFYDAFKYYEKRVLPARPPNNDMLVVPQTRHTVREVFKKAYERGGLELFGYPQTGQFYEKNHSDGKYYLVQYFERVRMEYHPEYKGTPNEVLFGLLGNQLLTERGWLDWNGQPVNGPVLAENKPAVTSDKLIWFQETRHTLSGAFLEAWKKQGGLSIVGLPKTRVFTELNPDDGGSYQVQYFERARMELHPGKNGQPDIVLFGLLGNDRLRLQNRLQGDNQPNLGDYLNPALPEFR